LAGRYTRHGCESAPRCSVLGNSMELFRTDVLRRECHPYGICASISPVPSAYALGYPTSPLRGFVAASGSCGCGSVCCGSVRAAGPYAAGLCELRVCASCGSVGLCGCGSMRLPRGYVAAKRLGWPTRLCGGCAVSYLVVRRAGAGVGEVMVDSGDEQRRVGLCADCEHARRMQSDRGSLFWRCELSATDPRFPKYPRLPVLECDGYKRSSQERS